jgi:uncharacterized protein
MQLVPGVSPLTKPYWDGARAQQLLLQRCSACGRIWHPPLPRCPDCHSADVQWTPARGTGHVYTYTTVYHATHVAMTDKVPYIVAMIELDEGPRVVTNLRNCSEDEVTVGMPVRVIFEERTPEVTLPQFEPIR